MGRCRTAEQVRVELSAAPRRALILTTVVHESRAVQSHLSDVELVTGSKETLYQLGKFSDPAGDWVVVHAICAAGNVDAAVTASGAHRDFGNFSVLMFVGVAGSLKDDVPIGSVVIGNYVYNAHSAKVDDEGQFSRPHGHAAAPELLQASTMLIVDGSWIDLIKPPVQTAFPAVADYPCPYPPVAEIKAIASGEQVVAGGKSPTYLHIRKFLNDAAAVEMEGWGAMSAAYMERTPALVIRGISDMCAGKDHVADKRYQPIASAHAAAFAFSVLSIRSRASPPGPDGAELQVTNHASGPATQAFAPRVEFVVNFKGALADWPEDKIESVLENLRKATGDSQLKLVRVEEGSVRLVVSVRQRDVSSLTLEAIRAANGDVAEQLLGAVAAEDLVQAEEARAALRRASTDLLSWERTLPGGGLLDRPEKLRIESRFRSEFSSTVVLGEPGSGKSALLAAIATDLVESGAPVLGIKADVLPTSVHSEQELQRALLLPELPGELIERLARLQPVYLLIDQLDALASQLDLQSDRLNVLLNLVRRVGGLPNVHVLLSARTFEFNHDVRLRTTETEPVTLTLPAWGSVEERLNEAGVDASTWPDSAREVIRNPQALKTYLSLGRPDDQPFSKYQSMLEQLWRQKIATTSFGETLASLASDIAGTMAEEEVMWIAASHFDAQALALERLESTGLIVRSDNHQSISFSHQTVFEYVLARSFVRAAGRLSTYVLDRQDSLFVRAKLWSALRYLRDAEIASYEREFLEIWRHEGLRRHLRLLLIEFLGEVRNPVAFEIVCLSEAVKSHELHIAGLRAVAGSPDWFAIFAHSAIPAAMAGDHADANQALGILRRAWPFAPNDVIRLLREQWLSIPGRDSLTWSALDGCSNWSPAVEELAHTIISRSPTSLWQVDYRASELAVEQPAVAFRLIRAKLDSLLDGARNEPAGKPFPDNGTHEQQLAWSITEKPTKPFTQMLEGMEWSSLPAIAEAEPQQFLEGLWAWFREVFEELRKRLAQDAVDQVTFPGFYFVDFDLEDGSPERPNREQPILSGLRLAVEGTAKANSEYFSNWVEENSSLELMAPQRLFAHGFSCAPGRFAKRALEWLFEDPRRLRLGDSFGPRKTTATLITAISPFWTDEQVRDFESKIQKYRPATPAEATGAQRRSFAQSIRKTKTHLLAAVVVDRLSEKSRRTIATEKRALGDNLDRGISFAGASFIGSPMDARAMAKAKDRDILKIFDEVPDNTDWDHPTSWMRGGNIQLSRAFAEFAKIEPARALRIMEQFKPEGQARAAGYALDSIAEGEGHDKDLQEALLDLDQRGFGAEEFRTSAAQALEKIANRHAPIDESAIGLLIEWLSKPLQLAEPTAASEGSSEISGKEKESRRESILWGHGGISVLPGGNFPILSALTSILLDGTDQGRDRLLEVLNNHLSREPDPKVWRALLIRLSNAGGSTPEVVSKFLRTLFALYPTLLETREAVYFLAHAQRWDDLLVHDLIATWRHAENSMLRQAQGELAGLLSIVRGSDRWITMNDQLLESSSSEAKIGLAYAGANLWNETEFHASAGSLLRHLVPGADESRMIAILDVFRLCDDLVPEPTTLSFLKALAEPDVDLTGAPSTFVVEKLQSLLPHAADLVGAIALKLVNAWREDLGAFGTLPAIAAPQLADLAITLHRLGGDSRRIGVTVFESLIDLDAYGSRDTLAEIDGQFGVQAGTTRRRIVRRAATKSQRRAA